MTQINGLSQCAIEVIWQGNLNYRQIIVRIDFWELTNLSFELKKERWLGDGLSIKRMPGYIGQIIDEDRGFSHFKTKLGTTICSTMRQVRHNQIGEMPLAQFQPGLSTWEGEDEYLS